MFNSFKVSNFKCFSDITFDKLGQINLISGKNNVGKTALLEALWIHHGYDNPSVSARVPLLRGIEAYSNVDFLNDMFYDFDNNRKIQFVADRGDGQTDTLVIESRDSEITQISLSRPPEGQHNGDIYTTMPPSETSTEHYGKEVVYIYENNKGISLTGKTYINEVGQIIADRKGKKIKRPNGIFLTPRKLESMQAYAERLSTINVKRKEERDKLLRILQIIEPRIKNVSTEQLANKPMIYIDVGLRLLLPLPLAGDGLFNVLRYILAILDSPGGLVLIDEIENGIHYSILDNLWEILSILSSENKVQLFATTHSIECINAARNFFMENEKYDFKYHRLEKIKDKITAVTYDTDLLENSLEADFEVR
ncbi:MAG: AAA family ATPase [Thermodesulfobacteriota bacterium]